MFRVLDEINGPAGYDFSWGGRAFEAATSFSDHPAKKRIRKTSAASGSAAFTNLYAEMEFYGDESEIIYELGTQYTIDIDVHGNTIVVHVTEGGGPSTLFQLVVDDPATFVPSGTFGFLAIGLDDMRVDDIVVSSIIDDTAQTLNGGTPTTQSFTESVDLGLKPEVGITLESTPYTIAGGLVANYKFDYSMADNSILQITGHSTNCPSCRHDLYAKIGSVSRKASYTAKHDTSRTQYTSLTLRPSQVNGGSKMYVSLIHTAPYDNTVTNALNFEAHLYFPTALSMGLNTGLSVSRNKWAYFTVDVPTVYENLFITVVPSDTSAEYLRVVENDPDTGVALTPLPTLTVRDRQATFAGGEYTISILGTLAGGQRSIGVFYTVDPDAGSTPPSNPPATITFSLTVLPSPPSLDKLQPSSGTTEGGATISILGLNLGSNSIAAQTVVDFAGGSCQAETIVGGLNDVTKILCTVPEGQDVNNEVTVTHLGLPAVDPVSLTYRYNPPTISGITGATTPFLGDTRGGDIITINGLDFGPDWNTDISVDINEETCVLQPLDCVAVNCHRRIVCSTPPGVGRNREVEVCIGTQCTTQNIFSYKKPVVTGAVALDGVANTLGNEIVVVSGDFFGTVSGQVYIGNPLDPADECVVEAGGWTQTSIRCLLPPGQGQGITITVVVGEQSGAISNFGYEPPGAIVLSPLVGDTDGLYDLKITGSNFGTDAVVYVNNVAGACVIGARVYTDGEINCDFPEGRGRDIQVKVLVGGQFSDVALFSYNPPSITGVDALDGPTDGMLDIVISGSSFGKLGSVTIGGRTCDISNHDHDEITCNIPEGGGATNALVVEVAAGGGSGTTQTDSVNFAYRAPSNIAINLVTLSTAGSENLIITGDDFGASGTVKIGGVFCNAVPEYGHHTIRCTTPPGTGTTNALEIFPSIGSLTNPAYNIAYKAPTISDINPKVWKTGGTAGGLVISGLNFGNSNALITVSLRRADAQIAVCANPSVSNHNSITCDIPEGNGDSITVRVTVNGQSVDYGTLLSYSSPVISEVTFGGDLVWTSGKNAADNQVLVTITGNSFESSGSVSIGGNPCPIEGAQYTHTRVVCRLPEGQGVSQGVVVTAGTTLLPSDPYNIDYERPRVFGQSLQSVQTNGEVSITFTGFSLGVSGTVMIDGNRPCTLPVFNHRSVTCITPSGVGTGKAVVVTVGTQSSTNQVVLDYNRPSISSLNPTRCSTAGCPLEISGFSFGDEGVISVKIGTKDCGSIVQDHNLIQCVVPAGEGSANVVVTVAGRSSLETRTFTYDGPSITDISSRTDITEGNDLINITGSSFGLTGFVTIGGEECIVDGEGTYSHDFIRCRVPAGQGNLLDIIVTVTNSVGAVVGTAKDSIGFSYATPEITAVNVLPLGVGTAKTDGNYDIEIIGTNFGDESLPGIYAGGSITIGTGVNAKVCDIAFGEVPSKYTHSRIVCQVRPGQGKDLLVTVAVNGGSSFGFSSFSYVDPVIDSVTGPLATNQDGPTAGGGTIVIIGSNFGVTGSVTIGDKACSTSGKVYSHSRIECELPAGQGSDAEVKVTVSNATPATSTYKYKAPDITGVTISAENSGTAGNEFLRVVGTNFGLGGFVEVGSATVPYQVCDHTVANGIYSHSLILCHIAPGYGSNLNVRVTTAGTTPQIDTETAAFSYLAPSIISTNVAASGALAVGEEIIITGKNFGSPSAPVSVTIQGITCDYVGHTQTTVTCGVRAGAGKGLNLKVNVGDQSTLDNTLFKYKVPALTLLTADSPCLQDGSNLVQCPNSASFTLTISGNNFGPSGATVSVTNPKDNSVETCVPVAGGHVATFEDSSFECTLTGAIDLFHQVVLTQNGAGAPTTSQSSNALLLSYDGPRLTLNTLRFKDDIGGSGLGDIAADGVKTTPTVELHGFSLQFGAETVEVFYGEAGFTSTFYTCDVTFTSSTLVECTLDDSAVGKDLVFRLYDGRQLSDYSVDTLSYPVPLLASSSLDFPPSYEDVLLVLGDLSEGDLLSFRAEHVGDVQSRISVTYGADGVGSICEVADVTYGSDVSFPTHSEISCNIGPQPNAVDSTVKFKVTVAGQTSATSDFQYSYPDSPTITSISGCSVDDDVAEATKGCLTKGGQTILITGTSLDVSVKVLVDGEDCPNVAVPSGVVDFTQITCEVPPGAGNYVSVVVLKGSKLRSLSARLLSYAAPVFTSIKGCETDPAGTDALGCLRTGGDIITIVGSDFGADGAVVLVGGKSCSPVNHIDVGGDFTTTVTCQLGSGTTTDNGIVLLQKGGVTQDLSSPGLTVSYKQCEAGTAAPRGVVTCTSCTPGRYTDSEGEFACQQCDAGRYAGDQRVSLSYSNVGATLCTDCPIGTFETLANTNCQLCIAGEKNPTTGQDECQQCPETEYQDLEGQTACVKCPAGRANNLNGQSICGECLEGTYSLEGQDRCTTCEPGRYANDTLTENECSPCPEGMYSAPDGKSCSPCDIGYANSVPGQDECVACETGKVSNSTLQSTCYTCEVGKVSVPNTSGLRTLCRDCPEGTYMPFPGQDRSTDICKLCEAGRYQNNTGEGDCVDCEVGKYSEAGAEECILCDPNEFADTEGSVTCEPCPAGTIAVGTGNAECEPCDAGSYEEDGVCKGCSPGSYQPGTGEVTCLPCQSGRVSGDNATDCTVCVAGTISNTLATACDNCGPGSFTGEQGQIGDCPLCDAGTFSEDPSNTECRDCIPGRWAGSQGSNTCGPCRAGTISASRAQACTPCGVGRISNLLEASTSCQICTKGYYQPLDEGTECLECETGTISTADGQQICQNVGVGFYAPEKKLFKAVPCPAGTFQDEEGKSFCKNCTAGRFNKVSGQVECDLCPAGRYINEEGWDQDCTACEPGKAIEEGTDLAPNTECTPCVSGKFANAEGFRTCISCGPGRYSSTLDQVLLNECLPCANGSSNGDTGRDTPCELCGTGEYQPSEGQRVCLECPEGEAVNVQGADACIPCEIGEFAETSGESVCDVCADNEYTPNKGATECLKCPEGSESTQPAFECTLCNKGFFSESGESCQPCAAGKFSSQKGQGECDDCLDHTISSGSASQCTPCDIGEEGYPESHALHGISCKPCDAGYFNDVKGAACRICDSGEEAVGTGNTKCALCEPGHAKEGSDGVCETCDPGTFAFGRGTVVCTVCGAGKYANDTGSDECIECPAGTKSDGTGENCTPCNEGFFSGETGASTCQPCPTGRFSNKKGTKVCTPCPRGEYQNVDGQTECEPCKAGSYNNVTGQVLCLECRDGFFSNTTGKTECDPCPTGSSTIDKNGAGLSVRDTCKPCDKGYHMDSAGQAVCKECPTGTATDVTGSVVCESCPVGSFRDTAGGQSCSACTEGKYAPNKRTVQCLECEIGKFRNDSHLDASVCVPCPQGYFANETGLNECYPCPVGSYGVSEGQSQCAPCPTGTFGVNEASLECDLCEEGTFQNRLGQGTCESCPIGRFGNAEGLTECKFCGKGTFSNTTGNVLCDRCSPGSDADSTNSTACDPCDPGSFTSSFGTEVCSACKGGFISTGFGSTVCTPCLEGTFANGVGNTECTRCTDGSTTISSGQTTCIPCGPGKYSDIDTNGFCELCSAGSFSAGGAGSCTACGAGTFQSGKGETTCDPCRNGETSADGASTCVPCPDGETSFPGGTDIAKRSCFPCGINQYEVENICQTCNEHFYTNVTGSTKCTPCPRGTDRATGAVCNDCDPGYSSGSGNLCTKCGPRLYAPVSGTPACLACPDNSEGNNNLGGSDSCVCSASYYWDDSEEGVAGFSDFSNIECKKCPEGGDCTSAGTRFSTMETKAGWWRASDNTKKFYRCLLRTHCPGGALDSNKTADASEVSDQQCDNHRTGPLCATCELDYHSPTLNGECVQCPDKNRSFIQSFFISILLMALIIAMYWLVVRMDRDLIREAKLRHERRRENEWAWFEEDDYSHKKSVYEKDIRDPAAVPTAKPNFTYKLKIILGFLQITTNLAFALDIPWPTYYQQFIVSFSIVNFDFIQWSTVGCVASVDFYTKWIAITMTPIAVLLLVFIFFLLPRWVRDIRDEEDYDLRRAARERSQRIFWKLFLFTLFLIYPGVSSTVLRLFVCREVQVVNDEGITKVQSFLLADFSIQCYDSTWWSYAIVDMGFIMLYPIGIPLFFFGMVRNSRHQLNLPDVRVQLGFLYEAYSRDLWWFELVDMCNKLILTSLIAFFPVDLQLPFGMVFAVLYLMVLLVAKPYVRKGDDRLHLFAQLEIFVILLAGYVFQQFSEGELTYKADVAMSIVLIILVISFMLFFLFQLAMFVRKFLKRRSKLKKAEAKQKEEAMEMTTDLRSLRLPRDAVMMRNPLYDQAEEQRKAAYTVDLETPGEFEAVEYSDSDLDDIELKEQYEGGAESESIHDPLEFGSTTAFAAPEVVDVEDNDSLIGQDDDMFKTEFAPRQMKRK